MSPEPTSKRAAKATGKAPAKATSKAAAKATTSTAKSTTKKAAAKATGETKKATKATKATAKATDETKPEPAARTGGSTTKATKATAAAVVEETPEHDHDHDHDHGDDHELTPEEQAQTEADVAKMGEALAAIDDDTMRHALSSMDEKSRVDLATHLQLPRATMHLGDALIPLVRRKLQTAAPHHQLQVLFALAGHVNEQTIEALGPRAEDPTRDDLEEVLPEIIEQHGVPLVTLMLAGYAASDAECRAVMREILESDDRFVIGPPVAVEAKRELDAMPAPALDPAELEAKRDQRRAAKEAKRAAQVRERDARVTAQAKRRQAVHDAKRKSK